MPDVLMPRLSDSMEDGTILTWLKAEGDEVAIGDELVEIETDKATMTYESPEEGVLRILVAAGTNVRVEEPIARIGEPATVPAAAEGSPDPAAVEARPSSTPPSANGDGAGGIAPGGVLATPLARRVAHAHGIDVQTITGTGLRGRVTRADVTAVGARSEPSPVPARAAPPAPVAASPPGSEAGSPAPASPNAAKGETTVVEPTRLQQVTARRMAEAKATVPHFQVSTEAQMDGAIALRSQLKELGGSVPSLNDFVVKAAALALREHPHVNASYRDGQHERHARVNVGVAVAADGGLLVPTVNDADALSLGAIAAEVRRLAAKARDGALTPPELSGATFTVSNLGMYGMTDIAPVVNPPQAAILGVGAVRPTLALIDGEVAEQSLMTMTVSADHRVLNGADAAVFLGRIRDLLQAPLRLAL